MKLNEILDDFSEEKELPKTHWWMVVISASFFLLLTFSKGKYLFPMIINKWGVDIIFHFTWITLIELILFLLMLRKRKYLSRDSTHTLKAAYLHLVISYVIISIIFKENKFSIADFLSIISIFSIIGLPIIIVATMCTNYITDRYLNKKS